MLPRPEALRGLQPGLGWAGLGNAPGSSFVFEMLESFAFAPLLHCLLAPFGDGLSLTFIPMKCDYAACSSSWILGCF